MEKNYKKEEKIYIDWLKHRINRFNQSEEKSYEEYFYLYRLKTSWESHNPGKWIYLMNPEVGKKNEAYVGFSESSITKIPEGTKIILKSTSGESTEIDATEETYLAKEKAKIVYDGRYCAVSGFIFAVVDGKYSVLANLRGPGCPDFIGYWNCPCGYLERNEDSISGIIREIREECGLYLKRRKLRLIYTETDPDKCNRGNVTIHHVGFFGKQPQIKYSEVSNYLEGEEKETQDIKWIPICDISNYKWAFNHEETIKKYIPNFFKRKILEFLYS